MTFPVLNYVVRSDISAAFDPKVDFEDQIVKMLLKKWSVALVGLPGTGKSSTAAAIAAKYKQLGDSEKDNPAIIISIDPTGLAIKDRLRLVKIDGGVYALPLLRVSAKSTNSRQVVQDLIQSIESLDKKIKNHRSLLASVTKAQKMYQNMSYLNDVKAALGDLIEPELIPQKWEDVLKVAAIVSAALPAGSFILNLAVAIGRYVSAKIEERAKEELVKRGLLLVIDDVEELRSNWQILSDVLAMDLPYLVVMDVESAQQYFDFVKNQDNISNYAKNKGFHGVTFGAIIPPPAETKFYEIAKEMWTDKMAIDKIWNYTGGFPSIAEVVDKIYEIDQESLVGKMSEHLLHGVIVNWVKVLDPSNYEENLAKRLVLALKATRDLYEILIEKNPVYAALFCSPDSLAEEQLALYCFCSSNRDQIFTQNKNLTNLLERLKQCHCCGNDRTFSVIIQEGAFRNDGCNPDLRDDHVSKKYLRSDGKPSYGLKIEYDHLKPMLILIQRLVTENESLRALELCPNLKSARTTLENINKCIEKCGGK